MPVIRTLAAIALGVAASASASASAAETRAPGADAAAQALSRDGQFIHEAYQRGLAEIAMGRAALDRAGDPAVRDLAARTVERHEALNRALGAVAADLAVGLPERLGDDDRAVMSRLETVSGEAFDEAYLVDRTRSLLHQVNTFLKIEAQAAADELALLAERELPELQALLTRAKAVRRETVPIVDGPVGVLPDGSGDAVEPPAAEAAPERTRGTAGGFGQGASPAD